MTAKMTITESEPVPLVKDFNTFTTYIKENSPSLVRKGHFLTKKTLYEINQLLTTPDSEEFMRTAKFLYPSLTLFYYLALNSNLFIKTSDLHFQKTERLAEYNQLSPAEKYFFLLEAFWVDTDWSNLLYDFPSSYLIPKAQSAIRYLARTPPGKPISMGVFYKLWDSLLDAHFFLEYLSFFGVLHLIRDQKISEKPNIVSATVTRLGELGFPVLYRERNLLRWNIPYIRGRTERFVILPGLRKKKKEHEPFFTPFQKIAKLQKSLPRKRYTKGTFTVKVSLQKGLERTIVLSSEHTLEELHEAIQDAFAFDKDHLHAFFTDGVPWSLRRVLAPQADEGPFSNQVCLGELGLIPGQWMLYVFDFGSEWHFKVEVLEINSKYGPPSPIITKRKGKSPEQYPEWE